MTFLEDYSEITRLDVPLAPLTWLKVGGPAQAIVEPRSVDEFQDVVRRCYENDCPVRMLGGGSNLLVRDDGVAGVVICLRGEPFETVEVDGSMVRAGAGALLSHVITASENAGLAGLEGLVGIPGTVGAAIKGNAGGRSGDIGSQTKSVTVVTGTGEKHVRGEADLSFEYRHSSINELAIVDGEFELTPGDANEISQTHAKDLDLTEGYAADVVPIGRLCFQESPRIECRRTDRASRAEGDEDR